LYTILIHAMKSASANVGAEQLSEAARKLEQASKEGNLNYIDHHTSEFLKMIMSVSKHLEMELDRVWIVDQELSKKNDRLETNKSEDAQQSEIHNVVQELIEALEDYDARQIEESVMRLQDYSNQEALHDMIYEVGQMILVGDYEDAVERLKCL